MSESMNQSDELSKLLPHESNPGHTCAKIRSRLYDCNCGVDDVLAFVTNNYLPKSQVVKAIGDEEVPATHDSMALAIIKNGLRSDIRRSLSLDGGEGE